MAAASTPMTLTVEEAAELLGIGRALAYELIRSNEFPTPVIRMGRRILVPLLPLLELVGAAGASQMEVETRCSSTPHSGSGEPEGQAAQVRAALAAAQQSCAEYHEHGSISGVEQVT